MCLPKPRSPTPEKREIRRSTCLWRSGHSYFFICRLTLRHSARENLVGLFEDQIAPKMAFPSVWYSLWSIFCGAILRDGSTGKANRRVKGSGGVSRT